MTVLVFGQWRFTVAMISRWGPFNQRNWRSSEELEKSDRLKNMKTLYYVALPSQGSSEPNDTWQSLLSDKTTERSSVCYMSTVENNECNITLRLRSKSRCDHPPKKIKMEFSMLENCGSQPRDPSVTAMRCVRSRTFRRRFRGWKEEGRQYSSKG